MRFSWFPSLDVRYQIRYSTAVLVVRLTPQGERVDFSLRTFVPTGHLIRHPVKLWDLLHEADPLTRQDRYS